MLTVKSLVVKASVSELVFDWLIWIASRRSVQLLASDTTNAQAPVGSEAKMPLFVPNSQRCACTGPAWFEIRQVSGQLTLIPFTASTLRASAPPNVSVGGALVVVPDAVIASEDFPAPASTLVTGDVTVPVLPPF